MVLHRPAPADMEPGALLALHKENLAALGPQQLSRPLYGGGVDVVLSVHHQPAGALRRLANLLQVPQDLGVHLFFWRAARVRLARLSEEAGQGLFTDHMLARRQSVQDHGAVQHGRRQDVDDVDLRVLEQVLKLPDRPLVAVDLLDMLRLFQVGVGHGLEPDRHGAYVHVAVAMESGGKPGADGADHHRLAVQLSHALDPFAWAPEGNLARIFWNTPA